jgi:hypothetical protein
MARPHNIADLYLAPVTLGIEAELDILVGKTEHDVLRYIALATNHEPRNVAERRADFIEAVTHLQEMHGWQASWDPRGLRLANDERSVVLGLPPAVSSYLADSV